MTQFEIAMWDRAREIVAESGFPDANPADFLPQAFRDIVRGTLVTAPVEDDAHTAWSVAQHTRRVA